MDNAFLSTLFADVFPFVNRGRVFGEVWPTVTFRFISRIRLIIPIIPRRVLNPVFLWRDILGTNSITVPSYTNYYFLPRMLPDEMKQNMDNLGMNGVIMKPKGPYTRKSFPWQFILSRKTCTCVKVTSQVFRLSALTWWKAGVLAFQQVWRKKTLCAASLDIKLRPEKLVKEHLPVCTGLNWSRITRQIDEKLGVCSGACIAKHL